MQIDFLIADHISPRVLEILPVPRPVQAPGGTNELRRTEDFVIEHPRGTSTLSAPDLVGAILLKSEAYKVDSRDADRHFKDAVTLALMLDEDATDPPLHGSAASRVLSLIRALENPWNTGKAGIHDDHVSDALIALDDLLLSRGNR